MSLLYCFERAYRRLITLNIKTTDPSETLNLIDLSRQEAIDTPDRDYAKYMNITCDSMETDLFARFTPPQLIIMCSE